MLPLRLHFEETNDKTFDLNKKYNQSIYYKPNGLWYSIKDNVYLYSDVYFGEYGYEIKLKNTKNILIIKTLNELKKFNEEYSKGGYIDWKEVEKKYNGIEFRNYEKLRKQIKYVWYRTIDFSSGCIWNLKCIKSIKYCCKIDIDDY